MNKRENHFNNHCNADPTNFSWLVGGYNQEWQNVLDILGKVFSEQSQQKEGFALEENLDVILENINRIDCPVHLNPQNATFNDVAIHASIHQRKSKNTIEKNLRYARFMELHKQPVVFRNPSYNNFWKHMAYREEFEKATPFALKHEWQAIQMFLEAFGIPYGKGTQWYYRPPPGKKSRIRILPLPEEVNKFFHYKYSNDKYENALYQYLFFHSFMIGWRVPSEIVNMKVSDVKLDASIPHIIITETKKHYSRRTLLNLEVSVLTSPIHKSFKNWIDHWRPRAENQYSGDSLYLQSNGKPFSRDYLRQRLSLHGKKIHPTFKPYDMRHWCAVARLIKTKVETKNFDTFAIQKWLGHEKQTTTDTYIGQAIDYYTRLPVDWISLALKPCYGMGGKQRLTKGKINRTPFSGLLNEIPSRSKSGLGEIRRAFSEEIKSIEWRFLTYRFFRTIDAISLNFFFFFFSVSQYSIRCEEVNT